MRVSRGPECSAHKHAPGLLYTDVRDNAGHADTKFDLDDYLFRTRPSGRTPLCMLEGWHPDQTQKDRPIGFLKRSCLPRALDMFGQSVRGFGGPGVLKTNCKQQNTSPKLA